MNDMMDGSSVDTLLSVLAVLLSIAVVAGAFAAGFLVARRPASTQDDPVELLRRRLAAGEIDDDEYLRRRSAIEGR